MDVVKEAFASRVRREGRAQCLVHLPRDPAELNKHDATKHISASEDPAVPCPFPDYDVKKMRDSFKLRRDKTVNRQATLTSPDAQMQCMQQMVMQQALQLMMGMSAGSQQGVPGPHIYYIYRVFPNWFVFDVFLDVAFSTPMVSIYILVVGQPQGLTIYGRKATGKQLGCNAGQMALGGGLAALADGSPPPSGGDPATDSSPGGDGSLAGAPSAATEGGRPEAEAKPALTEEAQPAEK